MSSNAKQKKDLALEVGARIGRALAVLGVSQSEFARQCGLSRSSVSLIVNRGQVPSLEVMRILGEDYGISLQWLLVGGPDVLAATAHSSSGDPLVEQIRLATSGRNGDQRRARLEGYLASLVAQAVDDEAQAAAAAEASLEVPRRRTA